MYRYFNPPTPCGVGPPPRAGQPARHKFQSTHPLRGGTCTSSQAQIKGLSISIHPPLAGWDVLKVRVSAEQDISIHPPLAGWDAQLFPAFDFRPEFQSTHPLRGGTQLLIVIALEVNNFNPPTPCGVGLSGYGLRFFLGYFNPPTPCGVGLLIFIVEIVAVYFNPPTPCGVGLLSGCWSLPRAKFQSTHPLRGGTRNDVAAVEGVSISIHPPLAGWDHRSHLRLGSLS